MSLAHKSDPLSVHPFAEIRCTRLPIGGMAVRTADVNIQLAGKGCKRVFSFCGRRSCRPRRDLEGTESEFQCAVYQAWYTMKQYLKHIYIH